MFPVDRFSEISIEQMTDTRIPKERYFRNRARGNKSPYFMIALTTPPLPYAEHMEVSAQIESYEGELEIFTLENPIVSLTAFTNKNVNATYLAGVKSLVITGSHAFRVGDLIQFDNHSKVYRISSVVRTTNTTVGISCPLVESINSATDLLYGANVVFQVCLNSSYSQEIDAKSKFGVVDVELIEQA
jgi:hypothetical protein